MTKDERIYARENKERARRGSGMPEFMLKIMIVSELDLIRV